MRLSIRWFRCHQELDLEFTKGGITGLLGPNGSGKSSVFYAMKWVLYGTVKHVDGSTNGNWPTEVKLILDSDQAHRLAKANVIEIYRRRNPSILSVVISKIDPSSSNLENQFPCTDQPLNVEDQSNQESNLSNQEYRAREAQGLIDRWFGPEWVWVGTSFIEQKGHCGFLVSTQLERLNLLTYLVFNQEEKNELFRKISEINNKVKERFQSLLIRYESITEIFQNEVERTDIDPKIILEENLTDENLLNKRLTEYSLTLQKLRDQSTRACILESQLRKFETQRESINVEIKMIFEDLKQIYPIDDQILKDLHTNEIDLLLKKRIKEIKADLDSQKRVINRLTDYQGINRLCLEKEEQLRSLSEVQEWVQKEPTNEDFAHAKNLESQLEKEFRIIKGLPTISSSILKLISDEISDASVGKIRVVVDQRHEFLARMIEMHPGFEIRNQLRIKTKNLDSFSKIFRPKTDIQHDLSLANEQYRESERRQTLLQCPKCEQFLHLIDGQLTSTDEIKVDQTIISSLLNEIKSLKEELRTYKDREILELECKKLTEDLEKFKLGLSVLNVPFNNEDTDGELKKILPNELRKYRQELQILLKLNLPSPPIISSKLINKRRTWMLLNKEIKQLRSQIFNEEKIDLSTLKKQYNNQLRECSKLTRLQKFIIQKLDISRAMSEIPSFDDRPTTDEIETHEARVRELSKEIEQNKILKRVISSYHSLTECFTKVKTTGELVVNAEILKKLTAKIWSKLLEQKIEIINHSISDIVEDLFEEPIQVRLELTKISGRKKRAHVQPTQTETDLSQVQVGLKIGYKGQIYDTLRDLSVSEGDRVSLAVALALTQRIAPPIFLLDEPFAYYSESRSRENSLEALRKYVTKTGGIVICTQPGGSIALYDQIVELTP